MNAKYHSPLRYPGGKGKLLCFVRDLILHNGLEGGSYSEPYAGGASVALGLLLDGYVSEIHINDFDKGIYSFWQSILNQTDEFLKRVWETPLTVSEWRKQLYIHKNRDQFNVLEVGFATFFLNRTNRSGVLSGGVIGGLDQSGTYKIDARYNREGLSKRIMAVACHKEHISLTQLDAIDFITKVAPKQVGEGLIFLDPPYYAKGKKLYTSFYDHCDHEAVAAAIKNSPLKHWIVTYDNVEQIDKIYDLKNKVTYDLRYSLNHQSNKGSELLFFSNNIQLPYHPNEKGQPRLI